MVHITPSLVATSGICKRRESMDLVSIIIPIHNEEKHIKRCLNSVINQSYVNLDILLIIDKSEDLSLEICNEYKAKDSRIRVYSVDHGVSALARNYGIENSKGLYITFIDADDYVDKDYIKELYDALIQNNCLVSMCDYIQIEDKKVIDKSHYGNKKTISSQRLMTDTMYNKVVGGLGCGKLWHKDLIKCHFRKYRYCEDVCFCVENLCEKDVSIAYAQKILYYYIVNKNSVTSRKEVKDLNDTLNVAECILQFAKDGHDEYRDPARALCLNYAFFAYLNANKSDDDSVRLRKRCLNWIKKLRASVLFNPKSSLKTKVACLISFISMKIVSVVYYIIKK